MIFLSSDQKIEVRSFLLRGKLTMFLMKKITDKSLRDIGIFLGGRDHSTVMHALDKVQSHAQENTEFQGQLRRMEDDILSSAQ